jgi:hypothetical protein
MTLHDTDPVRRSAMLADRIREYTYEALRCVANDDPQGRQWAERSARAARQLMRMRHRSATSWCVYLSHER